MFFFLAVAVSCAFTKDGGKRGSLIQAMVRSNYAIIGLPLAESLFGAEGAAAAGERQLISHIQEFCAEHSYSLQEVTQGYHTNYGQNSVCRKDKCVCHNFILSSGKYSLR
mgnify:CR=1 FL=1